MGGRESGGGREEVRGREGGSNEGRNRGREEGVGRGMEGELSKREGGKEGGR